MYPKKVIETHPVLGDELGAWREKPSRHAPGGRAILGPVALPESRNTPVVRNVAGEQQRQRGRALARAHRAECPGASERGAGGTAVCPTRVREGDVVQRLVGPLAAVLPGVLHETGKAVQ